MSKKIMKRSLALGALMAFVITGQAWAAETKRTVDGKYVQLGSESNKTVSVNELKTTDDYINGSGYIAGSGERVLGGYRLLTGVDNKNAIDTNVNVTDGYFNMVVGGNYSDDTSVMSVSSTNVILGREDAEDDEHLFVKQAIAGTGFSGVDANDNDAGRTTSLTILSGHFGGETDNTNRPEMHVVGGDLVKTAQANQEMSTTIESTNVVIKGGTFDAAIYGGSAAIRSEGNYGTGYVNATVNNANVIITGGTFNDAIAAGGLAWGHQTKSIVKNASVVITGGTFNSAADVYAGGLIDGHGYNLDDDYDGDKDGSIVSNTTIDIKNVKVNSIYGTDGTVKSEYKDDGGAWLGGNKRDWVYGQSNSESAAVNTTLKLTNVTADNVVIPEGSVTLRVEDSAESTGNEIVIGNADTGTELDVGDDVPVYVEANGEVNDAYAGDYEKMVEERFKVNGYNLLEEDEETGALENVESVVLEAGEVMGQTIVDSTGNVTVKAHEGNSGISDISAVGLMAWRAETNDMNKRLGELRNANGEHGVWVRMVRGESEYNSVKNQYNQYQLGYDEKLSVDKSWTVGMALSYTDAESSFSQGNGENTHKGLAIYGSKLNDDGSFLDLIAKYSRIEHDFDLGQYKGDYDTNGYSVSAEYGKRFQQGNGVWVEPQVELTYGQVDSATYMVGGRTVNQDSMETLVGRVGFSLGKDISKGNVYARASYLYDFEGETEATYSKGVASDSFKQDLGGGWWEVGVGANINLSKATYIYADVEKTFGGEVDTNWQWNLGVRYSF